MYCYWIHTVKIQRWHLPAQTKNFSPLILIYVNLLMIFIRDVFRYAYFCILTHEKREN